MGQPVVSACQNSRIAVRELRDHADNIEDIVNVAGPIVSEAFGAKQVVPVKSRGGSGDAFRFQGAHKLLEFA